MSRFCKAFCQAFRARVAMALRCLPTIVRKKRFALTLMEMIIVMILIATITGAIAVNYQKSLDKGRVYASERRVDRLKAIAHIYFAEHPEDVGKDLNWERVIDESGLGSAKPEDLLKDDWGNKFEITVNGHGDGTFDIDVTSERLRNERKKRGLG